MARVAAVVSNGCSPDPRVLREARWLANAGHEVTVHAFDRLENLPEEESIDGVRVVRHRVGMTPYGGMLSTVRGLSRFRDSVSQSIGAVDLIHCHDADTLSIGVKSASPVIFDMHDLHHTWALMPNPRSLLRKVVAHRFRKAMLRMALKADVVITSSSGFQSWLAERGIDSTVVENRPEGRQPLPPAQRFTVGYLGRVRELESFQLLLAAVKQIPENGRPRLLIAGDGTQSVEVANMVRAAVGEGWLEAEVFGAFDSRQQEEMMEEVSVMYAMYPPSRGNIAQGALPVKMFDAASFGRPSVVNSACHMGEVCKAEGLGVTVDWGDSVGLAAALQQMHGGQVVLENDSGREQARFMNVVEGLL